MAYPPSDSFSHHEMPADFEELRFLAPYKTTDSVQHKLTLEPLRATECALPDDQYAPSSCAKIIHGHTVTRDGCFNLPLPEFRPRRRHFAQRTAVSVPETSVNEHRCMIARQHQIRPARKVSAVQAKSKTTGMQAAPQEQLRFRIPSPDAAHIEAALLRREYVDHHRLMVPLRPRQCSAGPQ
jgi:hypothetical protein